MLWRSDPCAAYLLLPRIRRSSRANLISVDSGVKAAFTAVLLTVLLVGCGADNKRRAAVCHSTHENPVLFDKVLIGNQPASNFPERTLTPVSRITRKLGKPDQVLYLRDPLFAWWRYGNTAYMVASLSANRPGHDYLAAKACDWKRTQRIARAFLRNR